MKNTFSCFPAKVDSEFCENFGSGMRINIFIYTIYFETGILINKSYRFLIFNSQVRIPLTLQCFEKVNTKFKND